MKRKSAIVVFLVGLIPQIIALGWPTMPDIIQLFFRILSGIAVIVLIVFLVIVIRDWRKAKNDVQMKQGEQTKGVLPSATKPEEQRPEEYISIEPDTLLVEGDDLRISSLQVKLRSSLANQFKISRLSVEIHIPWPDGIFASFASWNIPNLPSVNELADKMGNANWYQACQLECKHDAFLPKDINLSQRHKVGGKATITYDGIHKNRERPIEGVVDIQKLSQKEGWD